MAGSIKGIIVEIGGDTSNLQKALSKVNSETSSLSKELKGINTLLKFDPKNAELLAQKQQVVTEQIAKTEEKLQDLQTTYKQAVEAEANGSKISEENWRNIQREIVNTENKLKQLKVESSNWTAVGNSLETVGTKIQNIGDKTTNAGKTLSTTLTPAIVGLGALAIKTFDEVDTGADNIIKKTGAVGEEAKALEDVYKSVSVEVVGSFEEVGNAVGEINTRFGFTDRILDEASVKFLQFAKVNNIDVTEAISGVSRYMGDANIESSKYGEVLDSLTSVAQASGISISSLTEYLVKYGAPMRALGLTTEESIAIFAGWEKAGVNTEIAFAGMKKAISNWSAEGKDASVEFKKTLDEIEKTPSIAEATTKAIEVFGAKAGPDLADAIKNGRFAYSDFLDVLEQSDGTLENTYNGIIDETDAMQISLKSLKIEFGEIGAKVLQVAGPSIEKFTKKIKELLDNFNNLDPQMQENILKFIGIAAVIGPTLVIIGKLTTSIGNVTKFAGTFSKAIGLAANGITNAEGTAGSLAKVFTNIASPIGIATLAIAAGATLIAIEYEKATRETRNYLNETKEATEKIQQEKTSIDELKTSIDNKLQSNLAEIDQTKSLWNELKNITDENGKIKDGYEKRAKVITNQLSEALGTEISITGNVIDKYKELQGEIDKLILKKQAEAIFNADQEKYNNAMKNRTQKTQELLDKQDELNTAIEEEKKLRDAFASAVTNVESTPLKNIEAMKNWENQKKAVLELKDQYASLNSTVNGYTSDIENYQYNLELYTEGTTDSLNKMINETGKTYEKNGETVKTTYLKQIAEQQLYNEKAKAEHDKAIKNNDESEIKKTQTTIDQSNRRISAIIQELTTQTSTIGENSEDIVNSWKKLSTESYDKYYEEVSKMPIALQQKIQEMTGVIVLKTPSYAETMEILAQNGVDALDKDSDFRQKAVESLSGYLSGLTNEEQRTLLKQAGIDNADEVIKGINQGSLSEDEGINILKGLYNGLDNSEWQNSLVNKAKSIANKLVSAFSTFSGKTTISTSIPGHKDGLDYVPYDNYVARLHKGERVLTANENKQLMNKVMDQTRTIFTTPQMILNFEKLDEKNLNIAFEYVNKRLGSKY